MIIEANINQLNEVLDFSWTIQSSLESSSYPKYENKEDLRTALKKCLNHKDDKLLICINNNKLIGALYLLVESENNYLSSAGIYVENDYTYAYEEFFQYLKSNYEGFEMLLGYPKENEKAIAIMNDVKADCIESSITMFLTSEDFEAYHSDIEVCDVNQNNFNEFAIFHDINNPDMYWTSSRIKEKISYWKIYAVYENNKIIGSILYGIWDIEKPEIFALTVDKSYANGDYQLALLIKTIHNILSPSKQGILYFIEEHMQQELKAAIKVGFKKTGHYKCFEIKL